MKQIKNSGMALFISLGISLLVLSIAISIFVSISRSLEQSLSIERSNQIFFAAESGMEAAFFHHNARGQGISFVENEESGELDSSQKFSHPSISAEVGWKIEGRTETTESSAEPIIGLIKEGQSIQIPFSWDISLNPSQTPNYRLGELPSGLEIQFYNEITSGEDEGSIEKKIYDTYGAFSFDGFDFGYEDPDENNVLIDWKFIGKRINDGGATRPANKIETLTATLNGADICSGTDSFLCEDSTFTEILHESVFGKILPNEIDASDETIGTFGVEHRDITISLRPLMPFIDIDDTPLNENDDVKIAGIPFSITNGPPQISLPKTYYKVTANIAIGNYFRTITAEIPERTSLGEFDYVILD